MARKQIITIEDVGGRFGRFIREAPKLARLELGKAVKKTVIRLADEIYDRAPPRSEEAPHIKDAIDYEVRGMSGVAGILEAEGSQPSAPGSDTTQAQVAVFNEYRPNAQLPGHGPFMRPAAQAIENEFMSEAKKALERVERSFSGGVEV